MKKDGFDIPLEVAAEVAILEKADLKSLYSKYLVDYIFDGLAISASDSDSLSWQWIAKQDISTLKSFLCWIIKSVK